MNFCGNCGHAVGPNNRFCCACGAPTFVANKPERRGTPQGSNKRSGTGTTGTEPGTEAPMNGPTKVRSLAADSHDPKRGAESRGRQVDPSLETLAPEPVLLPRQTDGPWDRETNADTGSGQHCPTCGEPWPANQSTLTR